MIARGFKPVGWVAAVGGAALGCYMLSLNVAAERAELASIERKIIAAKQDIRSLQTELGTRGRLQQLEHWNAEVLALSAPTSSQFLESELTLARYNRPEPTLEDKVTVRMAAAETSPNASQPKPQVAVADYEAAAAAAAQKSKPLVRQASYVVPEAELLVRPAAYVATEAKPAAAPKSNSAKASQPKQVADKKAAPISQDLIAEIGAAARAEKQMGGTAGQ